MSNEEPSLKSAERAAARRYGQDALTRADKFIVTWIENGSVNHSFFGLLHELTGMTEMQRVHIEAIVVKQMRTMGRPANELS